MKFILQLIAGGMTRRSDIDTFSVSDKVTLASHIGDGLYYNHTWMKDVARSNEFGFNLFHGISFGAYYFF